LFTPDEFNEAILQARKQLDDVSQALGQIECPPAKTLTFNLSKLTSASIVEVLKDVPGKLRQDRTIDYVYIIHLPAEKRALSSQLRDQLKAGRNDTIAYSRINDENMPSHTLYVGRSKDLKSRLRQHLGAHSLSVYSIHFECWAKENDLDVSIDYMCFENADDLLIQAIEDGLWASLKPAFGRTGAR
jgi:hypothetical protein